MTKLNPLLLITITVLIVSCASGKYLGTKQTSLAAVACPIEQEHCSRFFEYLDNGGNKFTLDAYYKLENVDSGTYKFTGRARLRHEHPVIINITYMDLYFMFFKDDVVVHQEKIRVKGGLDRYHNFSRLIKSDAEIKSSYWFNFAWHATE